MTLKEITAAYREKHKEAWEGKLAQCIAENIWDIMLKTNVSSLDMKNSLVNNTFGFSETSLLNILRGDELVKGEEDLDAIAMFLGVRQDALFRAPGARSLIQRPIDGGAWHDTIVTLRAKHFFQNVSYLIGKGKQISIEEVAAKIPCLTKRDLELMRTGVKALTARIIEDAAAALSVSDEPELISARYRKGPNKYPTTIDDFDGGINAEAFGFNLRSTMWIRLWTVQNVATRTRKFEKKILRYMSGREAPATMEEILEMANDLGVDDRYLTGECYSLQMRRKAQREAEEEPAANDTGGEKEAPAGQYEAPPLAAPGFTITDEYRQLMAANTRQLIRTQGNITRDGGDGTESIKSHWMKTVKVEGINLVDVWSGEVPDPMSQEGRELREHIAQAYHVPSFSLVSSKVFSEEETTKKIKALLKLRKAGALSERQIPVFLAMVEEELAHGSQMP